MSSATDSGSEGALGTEGGLLSAPASEHQRCRYGWLGLRSYDPRTQVLVRPQVLQLSFPLRTELDEALAGLRAAAGELALGWVVAPHA